jgi:UDP-glucose 4-epimerase
MTWLLTGGAGYIGAHVTEALVRAGNDVVVFDDLSTGERSRVPSGIPLVVASTLDPDALRSALREHSVTGVIHLAAKKSVEESVRNPLLYYRENVVGLHTVLSAMVAESVGSLVFSSSAAVYGMPDVEAVTEATPTTPINPYGNSKLVGEWLVRDVVRATGMQAMSLRYFNVAGASRPDLGDTGTANLVPLVFRALDDRRPPQIFGDTYPTPDGSCIRDYVHVEDLAEAHVTAAAGVGDVRSGAVYNVGRGEGYSVKEVLAMVRDVTGVNVESAVTAPRPGDPAKLVACADAIRRDLGWTASRDLTDIIDSAWRAWRAAR